MAGAEDRSNTGGSAPSPGSGSTLAASGSPLSAEERKAKLARIVGNMTRESRAGIRIQGEFETVLVRGDPVNHRLHVLVAVCLGVGVAAVARLFLSSLELALPLVVAGGYCLFWLFLSLTGGEELDRIAIDEQGVVTSDRSGHAIETRIDFLKVAVPGAIIAYTLFLIVGLSHDIVVPPFPNCNVVPPSESACLLLPNLADLLSGGAQATPTSGEDGSVVGPSPEASPSPEMSPAGSPEASPTIAPTGGGVPLTVDQTKVIERMVRSFQLFLSLVLCLSATWFLLRMLTGRWVLWIEPARRPGQD